MTDCRINSVKDNYPRKNMQNVHIKSLLFSKTTVKMDTLKKVAFFFSVLKSYSSIIKKTLRENQNFK